MAELVFVARRLCRSVRQSLQVESTFEPNLEKCIENSLLEKKKRARVSRGDINGEREHDHLKICKSWHL